MRVQLVQKENDLQHLIALRERKEDSNKSAWIVSIASLHISMAIN
jgi:hypothetical protein